MPDSGTPSILERILGDKRVEVERRKTALPLDDLLARNSRNRPTLDFREAILRSGLTLIAEFKRASPSKGDIFPDADPATVVRGYETGGARAISVLTDEKYFGGSDTDLQAVRQAVDLPVLRKDFVVDSYQIHEARYIGADAVLLIVAALTDTELTGLLTVAQDVGVSALVETHSEQEVDRAVEAGADIIGINNRNLHTFETTIETTIQLRDRVPDGTAVVSESGIFTREDTRHLEQVGVDAILVGEALMRASLRNDASVEGDTLAGEVRKIIGD
jgi:indole-3-glycerol phosphate synthase